MNNEFGSIPDGWIWWTHSTPFYWGTTDHDFTVVEHASGWAILDGGGHILKKGFKTAGAACKAANELWIETAE